MWKDITGLLWLHTCSARQLKVKKNVVRDSLRYPVQGLLLCYCGDAHEPFFFSLFYLISENAIDNRKAATFGQER